MLELTCTNEQKIKVTIAPVTAAGRPSAIQPGTLTVEVQEGEGTVATISDTEFFVVSQDVLDETPMTLYKVSADADLGEGVETLVDFVQLTVGPARAISLGLSAGAAEPK